jgi:hypothetical protein
MGLQIIRFVKRLANDGNELESQVSTYCLNRLCMFNQPRFDCVAIYKWVLMMNVKNMCNTFKFLNASFSSRALSELYLLHPRLAVDHGGRGKHKRSAKARTV